MTEERWQIIVADNVLQKIEQAVKNSSRIILNAKRDPAYISSKEGHANFVTTYDKQVQEDLFSQLAEILPEAKFMGEEDDKQQYAGEGYLFVVDPIDGTTNFIKDYKASAISVALLKDGEPVLAAIYNPYQDEMFTAEKGKGAWLNGSPIHVTDEPLENVLVLPGTSPYYEEMWKDTLAVAYQYLSHAVDLRRSGSAAIDLCSIACGRAGVFFELLLSPWDYAAGSLLVREAGGTMEGLYGGELQFEKAQPVIAYGSGVKPLPLEKPDCIKKLGL